MYTGMLRELNFDGFGIIMVRSDEGSRVNEDDISMSGPRIAQYAAGSSTGPEKVYVVSNVNEQWVSDAQVKRYFSEASYGTCDISHADCICTITGFCSRST